ncbi:DUF6153 family protein [Microbacterium proteolyticum]|uniref:DUF6153 family protein n=1 Tax=Microbacterium proteolyticum TaxID=1572644 RepID=UPI001FABAD81|nr:DUF6153 family protein [Microbacterium proteolyticum]MCI9857049.1 hypothetical protein [Microbacterium proteolyticum]
MKVMSELVRRGFGAARLVLAVPVALAIIAGLLSMHVLTAPHDPAPHDPAHGTAITAMSAAGTNLDSPLVGASPTRPEAAEGGGAACSPGECDDPSGMPDHSMLMMTCVLALLTALVMVFAAGLRTSGTRPLCTLRPPLRVLLAALRRPRPPSLLVLCISRT